MENKLTIGLDDKEIFESFPVNQARITEAQMEAVKGGTSHVRIDFAKEDGHFRGTISVVVNP